MELKSFTPLRNIALAVAILAGSCGMASASPLYEIASMSAVTWGRPNVEGITVSRPDPSTVKWTYQKLKAGTGFRCLLTEPIALPASVQHIAFWLRGNDVFAEPIVTDSRGEEFVYRTRSQGDGWRYLSTLLIRPGGRINNPNIAEHHGGDNDGIPEPPLLLKGVDIKTGPLSAGSISLSELAFDSSKQSDDFRQWSVAGRTLKSVLPDADFPFVFADELCPDPGQYLVQWRVYDLPETRLLWQGQTDVDYDPSHAPNGPTGRVRIPVSSPGTYSLKISVIDRNADADTIDARHDKSYTLRILRGDAGQPALPVGTRPLGAAIDFNPTRPSRVYTTGEPKVVTVRLWKPTVSGPYSWRYWWGRGQSCVMGTSATADFRGKDYVDEAVTIAGWDAGSNPTVAFGAQLSSSNGPIAQASRTFGVSADLPADPLKVSAQALNRDDVRRVYGNLVTVGNYDQDLYSCSQADFERYIDSLKDAGYNCYILHIGWQNHMPLPGVGNFVLLDKRVAYLDKVGMPYILAFDWGLNNQPGWLDFDLMEDQSGDTQVWNGYQRLPTTTDPKFRAGIASFIHAAQAHYMADKNLIGYEFLGIASDWLQPDAPYLGITVDYSPAARTAFQRYLHRVRRFELPDLNKRYGTSYKTYQEVPMPSPSYEHPIDVSPQWRDFMAFKVWYSSDYIRFVADAIRAFDQRRNITVYSMGGAWMPYAVMKAKGISVANGGAEGEHQSAPRFSRELMYGIPDRTESVSTEFSSEIRVDSNVFNMLSNGGLGTSINNYWKAGTPVYPGVPGARQKAYWLKWTKILDELKDTAPTVDDVAVVSSPAGLFYAVRTVFGEVAWYPDWDQERIIANAENLRPHWLYEEDLPDGLKGNRMAILFGSCASLIEPETVTSLVNYVKQGGTLVIDTKSGSAIPDPADTGDALWRALGLPTAKSYPALFGEKVGKVDVPVADTGKAWLADGLVSLDNPAYFAKNLPGGTPLLSDAAGRAVCWQFPVGAGTVIAFTGQLNYPRCKPFLGALYRMLGGRVPVTPSAPEIKTAWLTGKNAHYLVAHRYLTQGYMGDASSDARIRALGTQSGTIALNALQPGSYRIECLTDLDTPPMTATADSLKAEGVPFTLHKGETAVWRVSAMSKP